MLGSRKPSILNFSPASVTLHVFFGSLVGVIHLLILMEWSKLPPGAWAIYSALKFAIPARVSTGTPNRAPASD